MCCCQFSISANLTQKYHNFPINFYKILYRIYNILLIYIRYSIRRAIPTIDRSSTIVTVDMGKLKTSPKHAHFIFRLSRLLFTTPMLLTPNIMIVMMFVKRGAILMISFFTSSLLLSSTIVR